MLSITVRLQNRGASEGSSATLNTGVLHFAGAALAAVIVLCGLLRPQKGMSLKCPFHPSDDRYFIHDLVFYGQHRRKTEA